MDKNLNNRSAGCSEREKFEDGIVETCYTEQGEPYYVIRDGLDVNEYAMLAKQILESEKDIAHDFKGKVVNESLDQEVFFEYKSGWFLEGLSEGEIE